MSSKNSTINETMYAGVYKDFAELIGEHNMKKVYDRYRGLKVDFPKRIYSKEYVMEMLRKYDGKKSVSELAQMFDYSERYIRKLIAEMRED